MNAEWIHETGIAESPFAEAGETPGSFETTYEAAPGFESTAVGEAPSWATSPFGGEHEWVTGEWESGEHAGIGEAWESGEYANAGEYSSGGEAWESGESSWGEAWGAESPVWAESPFAGEMIPEATGEATGGGATGGGTRCADQPFGTRRWTVNRPGRHDTPNGDVGRKPLIQRAEVTQLALFDFDIDDYRLRPAHHAELDKLVDEIASGLRSGRYLPMVEVVVRGEASSTATDQHNLELSRHRAWNVDLQLRCRLNRAAIGKDKVSISWTPIGESVGQTVLGQNQEAAEFRRVRVLVIAPIPACACPPVSQPPHPPPPPYPPRPPQIPPRPPRRRPIMTATQLCVSVPQIQGRSAARRPPDVISLRTAIPGLPAPAAMVTNARALIRVDNVSSRASASFELQGWGLEIGLPTGVNIDVRARLRATLEVIARASASLSASLRLGPLGLSLRVDGSAFAQALVQIVGQLRLRLDASFAPNLPEPQGCARLLARKRGGPLGFQDFVGPAMLVVPGRGLGPASLQLSSSPIASRQIQVSSNPLLVPADKSTVRTVLVLAGTMRMVRAAAGNREDEASFFHEHQPESAFGEVPGQWNALESTSNEWMSETRS